MNRFLAAVLGLVAGVPGGLESLGLTQELKAHRPKGPIPQDLEFDADGNPILIKLSAAELGTRIHERLEADLNRGTVSRETDPVRTYDPAQVTFTLNGQPFDPDKVLILDDPPPRDLSPEVERRIREQVKAWFDQNPLVPRPGEGPTAADIKADLEQTIRDMTNQGLIDPLADTVPIHFGPVNNGVIPVYNWTAVPDARVHPNCRCVPLQNGDVITVTSRKKVPGWVDWRAPKNGAQAHKRKCARRAESRRRMLRTQGRI